MNIFIEGVLGRKDISAEDKFRVYETKILAMHSEGTFTDALTLAIDVRKQLGLKTPPNKPASKLTILKEYIKTSRVLGSMTAEEIASLPKLTDQRIIMGQRMLELMITSTFMV